MLAGLATLAPEVMTTVSFSPVGGEALRAACSSFISAGQALAQGTLIQPSPVEGHALLAVRVLICRPWADWDGVPATCSRRCMAALHDGTVVGACQARQTVAPSLHLI